MIRYTLEVFYNLVEVLFNLRYCFLTLILLCAFIYTHKVIKYHSVRGKAERRRIAELEYEYTRLYLDKGADAVKELAIDTYTRETYLSEVRGMVDEKIKDSIIHGGSPENIKGVVADIDNTGVYYGSRIRGSYASGYLAESDLVALFTYAEAKGYTMSYTRNFIKLGLLHPEVLKQVDISLNKVK